MTSVDYFSAAGCQHLLAHFMQNSSGGSVGSSQTGASDSQLHTSLSTSLFSAEGVSGSNVENSIVAELEHTPRVRTAENQPLASVDVPELRRDRPRRAAKEKNRSMGVGPAANPLYKVCRVAAGRRGGPPAFAARPDVAGGPDQQALVPDPQPCIPGPCLTPTDGTVSELE